MSTPLKILPLIVACALATACGSLTIQPTSPVNGMDTTMGKYDEAQASRYIIVTMTDAMHEQLAQGERVDREAALPPQYAQFLSRLSRTYGLKRVADWPLGSLGIRCLVFEVADPAQRAATIAALSRERYVESAQEVGAFFTSADAPGAQVAGSDYNDPYRNMQHALKEMQIPESHRWATGRGVRVAVIDTGADTRHPELRERITGIRNFVDRDGDVFNGDIHGTAVTGVIAAASNNGTGLVGVAPEADILSLKACWHRSNAPGDAICNSFTLAKALNFAIDQQVDVINLSLGGPTDPLLSRLVSKALEQNILVVGAATPKFPEGFPVGVAGVIGVSNAGAPSQQQNRLVNAPGNQVLSTSPGNQYDFFTGSSFSAAQISGVAALIRQRKPHLPAKIVKELLAATSNPEHGFTNACRAVARVAESEGCGASPTVSQATDL
jgi:subtilisin family serine protease